MPTQLLILTNPQIKALQPRIVEIYRQAFTPPPYNKPAAEITEFAQALTTQFDRQGYRFVGAFGGNPERLVGFAYGYACLPERWWYQQVRPVLPQETAETWLADSFNFVEIAVDPQLQEQGFGSRLHDALLDRLPYARAVLSTLQADTAAQRLYRRRGWVVLLKDFFFPGVDRRYQIMGLDRR
jgi:ribosomal protein S18 acetylase RimI-like enzyme